MPGFIACPLCSKSGLLIHDVKNQKLSECLKCPVCGPKSHQYGVPPEISRIGFTTKSGYNAYQRAMATNFCKPIIQRALEKYISENPGISNQKLKTFQKEQTEKMLASLLQAKFKLKE
jgi:hypothetical protein